MPKKSTSSTHLPRPLPQSRLNGAFDVRITLRGGVSPKYARALERGLLDYLVARDLEASGSQLHLTVSSSDRELTTDDQVALLVWLIDDLVPASVELGPVKPRSARTTEEGEIPVVRVNLSELTLIPMAWLYRAGRLDADQMLKMMGEFTCTSSVH